MRLLIQKAAQDEEPLGGEQAASMSVVIEDDIPEDFEPSEEEIHEYAKWLGMDLATDKHLLWIARDGIKAPLPADWKPCKSSSGDIYYFNFRTGDSRWEHPQVDARAPVLRACAPRAVVRQRVCSVFAP